MSKSFAITGRDSFARFDYIRRVVDAITGGCTECGGLNRWGKLFQYGAWGDQPSDRRTYRKGSFCCIGCSRAYHGE